VKKSSPGSFLIGIEYCLIGVEVILCLEIDPLLLLSLLVVDSQKFVEDCTLIYIAWIEQEFHFLFFLKLEAIIFL
jgi:hypothetical protein